MSLLCVGGFSSARAIALRSSRAEWWRIHASGFSEAERTPAHCFLRIKGGFLSVQVDRADGKPRVVVRHQAVDGQVQYEDNLEAR